MFPKGQGKLEVAGTFSLRWSAVIDWEVVATKPAIESGTTFNATCSMKGAVKSLKNERSEGRK